MANDCVATHPTNQAVTQPSNQAAQQPTNQLTGHWMNYGPCPGSQAGRQAGSDSADVDTDTDASARKQLRPAIAHDLLPPAPLDVSTLLH